MNLENGAEVVRNPGSDAAAAEAGDTRLTDSELDAVAGGAFTVPPSPGDPGTNTNPGESGSGNGGISFGDVPPKIPDTAF